MQAFIESVHKKIADMTKHTVMFSGQVDLKNAKLVTAAGRDERAGRRAAVCSGKPMPLFDRFVRAENVEALAGPAEIVPMFRPIQFTHIP